MSLWTLDNPIFRQYVVYASITAAKMLIMGPLTGRQRMKNNAFVNQEDGKAFVGSEMKPITNHPDVERVRRAHQNDLENIPLFWIIGLLYVLTSPSSFTASICYGTFTLCRICHTFFYLNEIAKPRGLCFLLGLVANTFMIGSVIKTFIF